MLEIFYIRDEAHLTWIINYVLRLSMYVHSHGYYQKNCVANPSNYSDSTFLGNMEMTCNHV